MKIKVNEAACIGCGACEAIASDYFVLNDERIVEAKKVEVASDDENVVVEACGSCPTSAIEAN